jgi:hypothetical protein
MGRIKTHEERLRLSQLKKAKRLEDQQNAYVAALRKAAEKRRTEQ